MHTKTKLIIAITFIISASSLVQAKNADHNNGERPQRPTFASLDLNEDSEITFDEFSSHEIPHGDHETIFESIDSDGDGIILEEEFTNHKPPRRNNREGERS